MPFTERRLRQSRFLRTSPQWLLHSQLHDSVGSLLRRAFGWNAWHVLCVPAAAEPAVIVQTHPSGVSNATRAAGFWSAVLATLFSLTYVVGQLAEWAGWLGSAGGPESLSTPLGIVVLLTPSLFLGSAFLVLMLSVHQATSPERRIWSHAAVAFSTVYTVLISLNYFVQLTWVGPRLSAQRPQGLEPFLFVPFDSFLYAVDILGYSFMSVATLFAALAIPGGGIARIARWFLVANGLLLPFIALQMYVHGLIWFAAFWAVTFPGATWSLALHFQRMPANSLRGFEA
jgi:hypothetical protein